MKRESGIGKAQLRFAIYVSRFTNVLLWALFAFCVLLGIVLAVFSLTWSALCWVFWLPLRIAGVRR